MLLKSDLKNRLQRCNLKVDEQAEVIIHSMTERYRMSMKDFHNLLSVLGAFSIFNFDSILTNTTSREFSVYSHSKINILSNHFFANQNENRGIFIEEWESFKFDLLSVRKKWVNLKKNLSRNNLRQQYTSTEWALKQICITINCEVCPIIRSFAKITYVIPVSNAWSERGGSAKKCIKISKRNILKNDALNALLMISVYEPQLATFQTKELIKHIARLYEEQKQYKKTPSIKQKQQETQTDSNYLHHFKF